MIDPELVQRLLHFSSEDAPVLSVYLAVPADPGELRGVATHLHSMLKPVRELVELDELGHAERESFRHDLDRVLDVANRARQLEGRGIGIFACQHAGLYEEIVMPRLVRDRAVVDATPYLGPLFAVLDESHRYCVVVVDREQAWIYEFYMGELEDASRVRGRALRKPDYAGGWQGYKERTVHDKAQQLARRHYRDTAGRVDEVMRRTGAELLVLGGHEETIAEFRHFLPNQLQSRIAGSFAVDPGTIASARGNLRSNGCSAQRSRSTDNAVSRSSASSPARACRSSDSSEVWSPTASIEATNRSSDIRAWRPAGRESAPPTGGAAPCHPR